MLGKVVVVPNPPPSYAPGDVLGVTWGIKKRLTYCTQMESMCEKQRIPKYQSMCHTTVILPKLIKFSRDHFKK
jgi:hypothetical protein